MVEYMGYSFPDPPKGLCRRHGTMTFEGKLPIHEDKDCPRHIYNNGDDPGVPGGWKERAISASCGSEHHEEWATELEEEMNKWITKAEDLEAKVKKLEEEIARRNEASRLLRECQKNH